MDKVMIKGAGVQDSQRPSSWDEGF